MELSWRIRGSSKLTNRVIHLPRYHRWKVKVILHRRGVQNRPRAACVSVDSAPNAVGWDVQEKQVQTNRLSTKRLGEQLQRLTSNTSSSVQPCTALPATDPAIQELRLLAPHHSPAGSPAPLARHALYSSIRTATPKLANCIL